MYLLQYFYNKKNRSCLVFEELPALLAHERFVGRLVNSEMTQQVVVVLELFAADVTTEVLDEHLVDGAYVAFQ
jgi:hypothetical protein